MTYMLGKSTKPRPLPTEPVPPGAYKELEDKMLGKSSNTREERIEKIEEGGQRFQKREILFRRVPTPQSSSTLSQ